MAQPSKSVALAVAGVAAGLLVGIGILGLLGSSPDEIRLGDDEFRAGRADVLADAVERDGPILYPDLLGQDRSLYLARLAADDGPGWRAVIATAPGQPDECVLTWDSNAEAFADPCGPATYEPGSARLDDVPVRVEDRLLYVDLNAAARATSTTDPP